MFLNAAKTNITRVEGKIPYLYQKPPRYGHVQQVINFGSCVVAGILKDGSKVALAALATRCSHCEDNGSRFSREVQRKKAIIMLIRFVARNENQQRAVFKDRQSTSR